MHKHLTWTDRLKIEKALKEGLKPCKYQAVFETCVEYWVFEKLDVVAYTVEGRRIQSIPFSKAVHH